MTTSANRSRLLSSQSCTVAGVFLTTLVAFFTVEMGDKTQLATVALAARYESLFDGHSTSCPCSVSAGSEPL